MPVTSGYSRDNINNSLGIIDLHLSWLNQSLTTTSSPTFDDITATGSVLIQGDLTVQGSASVLSTDITEFKDNILLINADESGTGITSGISGIEIDRGTLVNFQSVFDEALQLYKIGFVGDLQAVATRDDSPLDQGIMIYDSSSSKVISVTDIPLATTFSAGVNGDSSSNGTINVVGSLGTTGDIYLDSTLYIKGTTYNSIDADILDNVTLTSGNNFIFNQPSATTIKIPTNVKLIFGNTTRNINTDNVALNISNTTGDINILPITNGKITIGAGTSLEWNATNKFRYDNTDLILDTTGTFIVNSPLQITNSTDASSSSSGSAAFINAGGSSIKKKVWIGDQLVISDTDTTTILNQGTNFRSINRNVNTSSNVDITLNSFEGGNVVTSASIGVGATVYIDSAPSVSGGGSIASVFALLVNSGNTKLNGDLIVNSNVVSTSSTIGSIVTTGSFASSNTSDSVSSSNGGSATLGGGIAVGKSARVGYTVDIGDTTLTTTQTTNQGVNLRSRNRIVNTSSVNNLVFNSFEGGSINTNAIIPIAATVIINSEPSITNGSGSITDSYSLLVNSGNTRLNGSLTVTLNTDATSEFDGGSISTAGGMSTAKKFFAGNEITSNNGLNSHFRLFNEGLSRFTLGLSGNESTLNVGSDFVLSRYTDLGDLIDSPLTIKRSTGDVSLISSTASTSSSIGGLKLAGGISISNTTNASSITNGGTFTSLGGGAFGQDFYIGGALFVSGLSTLAQTTIDTDTGELNVSGSNGISMIVDAESILSTTAGNLTVSSQANQLALAGNTGITINSVSGGVSINANNTSNFSTTVGTITIAGVGINLSGGNGDANISSNTGINIGTDVSMVDVVIGNTTSTTTIGDHLVIGGDLTVNGTLITLESSTTVVFDNVLTVNAGPVSTSDGGYLIKRYQPPNNSGSGDVVNGDPYTTSSFQSGSSLPHTLKLNASASSIANFYNGWWIKITSGVGLGQVRRIKEYDSVTKIAIVYDTNDNSSGNSTSNLDGMDLIASPAAADTYILYDFSYAGFYYSADDNEIKFAHVPYDISSGRFNSPSTYLNLHVFNLVVEGAVTYAGGDTEFNGRLAVNTTEIDAFTVSQESSGPDILRIDTVNGDLYLANPSSTGDVSILLQQYDSLNNVQTYSQINSNIINNVNGNLRNNLTFSVQKDTSGLSTFLTLTGGTTSNSFADFSSNVDSVRILGTTDASSTTTGAFISSGSGAFAKKLFVGGNIHATNLMNVSDTDNTLTGTEGSLNVNGDLVLYNSTKNTIIYSDVGSGVPTFNNRSVGSKLVLKPSIGASTTDTAIGIVSDSMWFSGSEFKFYTGITEQVSIGSTGVDFKQAGDGISFYGGLSITEDSGSLNFNGNTKINSKLSIGIVDASALPSSVGCLLDIQAFTLTDNTTTSSGTITTSTFNSIQQPTLASIASNVTTTNAINTFIGGAVIKGTNEHITNSYGLYIAQGSSLGTTTNASSLYIEDAPTGTITNAYAINVNTGTSRFGGMVNIDDSTKVTTIGTLGSLNINGDLTLYNGTNNTIVYSSSGSAAPSYTNRSLGTKLVLKPLVDASHVDVAIGCETNAMWYSVADSSYSHKFYLGTSSRLTIDNTGLLLDSSAIDTASIIRLNTSDASDNKGVILCGGGSTGSTRGAQLELYGNEYVSGGNALLSSGSGGLVSILTDNNVRLNVLNTGETIVYSSAEEAFSIPNGGLSVNKSVVLGTNSGSTLALDFNQRYTYSGNVSGHLNIQSATTTVASKHNYFTYDGDNTTSNYIEMYGLGTPASFVNTESMVMGYNTATTNYTIKTQQTGTGTARPFVLQSGTNNNQLLLLTTGQVSFSSTEASTSSITGSIRTGGGFSTTNTTNASSVINGGTFTSPGGGAFGKDFYVGGNIICSGTVSGSIASGVVISSPTITDSNKTNITGSIISSASMDTNGDNKNLYIKFEITPTTGYITTSFEFDVPDATVNFAAVNELHSSTQGYRNDADPIDISNTILFAVTGTTRAKVKFTAGGTDTHYLNVMIRYIV